MSTLGPAERTEVIQWDAGRNSARACNMTLSLYLFDGHRVVPHEGPPIQAPVDSNS